MANDRHIRRWLLVTLITSVAFSQFDAQPRPARRLDLSTLSNGSSTRVRLSALRMGSNMAPRPFEGFVVSQAVRDSIVSLALAQLGMPYVLGGATPRRGFDCSGLVRYVVEQVHVSLPRTARLQASVGAVIERDRLLPGDLLAFGEGRRISHIGIYVGDGKFVHASSIARRVIVSPLDRRPSRLIRPMKGARRLLAASDAFGPAGGG
jgi:hypothetical protein